MLKHINPPNVFSHSEKSRNQFRKDKEMRSLISLNCLSIKKTEMVERQAHPPHQLPSVVKGRAYWPAVALSGSHSAEKRGRTCWQVLRAGGRLIRSPRSTLTDIYAGLNKNAGSIVKDHTQWAISVLSFASGKRAKHKQRQTTNKSKTNMLEKQLLSHNN